MILHYDRLGAEAALTGADTGARDPVMARLASGGFVLAWREEVDTLDLHQPYNIRVQLFDPAGARAGASFLAAGSDLTEAEPAVTALAGGGFAVAWREGAGASSLIKIQAYDNGGAATGAPIAIAGALAFDPAISQLADGSLAVTWVSSEPTPYVYALRAQRFGTDGAPLGEPATLSTKGVGDFSEPQVIALDSGGYVVTWFYLKGAPSYQRTIEAQIFGADGTALGPIFEVSGAIGGDQRSPQVTALAGGGFVIVWSDSPTSSVESVIRGRLYADDGAPLGAEFQVNQNIVGMQILPKVTALAAGGFAVSWNGWDGAGGTLEANAVNLRFFDSAGQAVGSEFRVDAPAGTDQGVSALVEYGSGEIAVVWEAQSRLRLQRLGESAGDGVSNITLSTSTVKEQTVGGLAVATVKAPGGAVNAPTEFSLIADSSGAFALVGDKLILADPRKLDFETQPTVQLTVRATDASGVAFDKILTVQVPNQAELPSALVAGSEALVNSTMEGFQHTPSAAKLAGGGYVVLWYSTAWPAAGVVGQLYDEAGAKVGGERLIGADGLRSSVSALGDGFVVAWVTEAGGSATIRGRRFDSAGAPVGEAFVVAETTAQGFGLFPKVEALAGGGFVIAWDSPGGADGSDDVFFQRFDSAGAKLGPLTLANEATGAAQVLTGIAALGDGGFLLVWGDYAGDGDGNAVRARRFAADGSPPGDSFQVHASAAGSQYGGIAAGQPDGSFAIVWTVADSYGFNPTLKLQLFDAVGARRGGEVTLSSAATSQWLGQATIEAQPGGGYVVSWTRDLHDRTISNSDIVAQRIGPNGELVGNVIEVNSTVYRAQQNSAVAADGTGGFLIAWDDQSKLDGGLMTDVRARIFTDIGPLALARNDRFQTDEATALSGLSIFSDNGSGADSAPASGPLQVVAVNGSAAAVGRATILASGARLTLQADGTFDYDPNGAFDHLYDPVSGHPSAAADRFTYTLAGGSTATVTLAISGLGGVSFTGGAGPDRLVGTPAGDRLDGGAGADEMIGGAGNDVYVVDLGADVVTEQAGQGTDEVRTSLAVYTLAANVEKLTATSDSSHDFRGNGGNNLVTGGAGSDILRLQDGGNDTVLGGAGSDNIFFIGSLTAADVINGGTETDTLVLQGPYGSLTLGANVTEIENVSILGGSNTNFGESGSNRYDYVLVTSDANFAAGLQARINGAALLAGEDFTFDGSAETDAKFVVFGGKGVDTLTGGLGHDIFFYAEDGRFASGDTVNGGPGYDGMFLRGNYTIDFNAPGYTGLFTNIENLTLTSATDERYARGGGTEFDYNLTLSDAIVKPGETLTVSGALLMTTETMILDASQESDGLLRLFGGRASDTLKGGANADLIHGNLGADILTGNGGADTFRFDSTAESSSASADQITDFTPGTDKVDLSRIDANGTVAGDQAFAWIGSNAFSGTAGELRAYEQSGTWLVEGDTNGDGSADLVIALTLQGPTPLGAGDFML